MGDLEFSMPVLYDPRSALIPHVWIMDLELWFGIGEHPRLRMYIAILNAMLDDPNVMLHDQ